MAIKQLKEKISRGEARLQKLMNDAESLWEETGLDPKDSSYLIEKTMRFELAQKTVNSTFSSFKVLVDDYKKLCQELEKAEE
ncbi:MAG TPA: hypothetical protein VJ771_03845 [Candidatus Nitrosotalea sp.]|nr:hypothetical protein [Candidatus Nitrosotalea sp.]